MRVLNCMGSSISRIKNTDANDDAKSSFVCFRFSHTVCGSIQNICQVPAISDTYGCNPEDESVASKEALLEARHRAEKSQQVVTSDKSTGRRSVTYISDDKPEWPLVLDNAQNVCAWSMQQGVDVLKTTTQQYCSLHVPRFGQPHQQHQEQNESSLFGCRMSEEARRRKRMRNEPNGNCYFIECCRTRCSVSDNKMHWLTDEEGVGGDTGYYDY